MDLKLTNKLPNWISLTNFVLKEHFLADGMLVTKVTRPVAMVTEAVAMVTGAVAVVTKTVAMATKAGDPSWLPSASTLTASQLESLV